MARHRIAYLFVFKARNAGPIAWHRSLSRVWFSCGHVFCLRLFILCFGNVARIANRDWNGVFWFLELGAVLTYTFIGAFDRRIRRVLDRKRKTQT